MRGWRGPRHSPPLSVNLEVSVCPSNNPDMIRLAVVGSLLVALTGVGSHFGPIENSVDLTSECALLLSLESNVIPAAYPYSAPQTCITVDAVNQAYLEARKRIPVNIPADGKWKHNEIASVGELLLDISMQLAKTYGMTVEDIEKGLPQMDTTKTMIQEVCPAYLTDVTCHAGKYRRHDGLCNNMNNPTWGASNAPFQRLMPPQYADGMAAPRESVLGTQLPLPRIVSRTIHPDEGFHDHAGTVMVVAWGQFMDHDFTLTGTPIDRFSRNEPEECCNRPPHLKHPYCMEITIPDDDYFYAKHGVKCQDFVRSFPAVRPNCGLGSRVPFNTLTGVIDGNTVYGVTEEFSRHLRTGYGGLLRMNPVFQEYGLKDLLPLKVDVPEEGCTRANNTEYCFEAGEIRVNEQLVLACMHTIMAREHNRLARSLAHINPHWDDETLYQEARRIVIAQIQHITYNEFLPIILGKEVMEKFGLLLEKDGYWDGYDPTVNPNIIDAFASAAFRFGHSLLPTAVERWSKAHKFIASKRLSDLIRRPYDLYRAGVMDEYLMGLMNQVAQAMDDSITQEVTNHLLKKPGHHFGLDLVAFNMQRGREFGIPGFMFYRKFCGLHAGENFEDLFGAMPNTTVHRYMQIFQHTMDVDLWSGGVSEKPLPGSMIGPTFACVIATQMSYLRRGDRFWYELPNQPSSFTPEQLKEIRKTKLSRILCDNTDLIDSIQVYPMVLPDYEINPRVPCRSGILPSMDLTKWADYGNEVIDPRTKKMRTSRMTAVTKLGNQTVPISNEPVPVPVNQTLLDNVNATSAPRNETFQVSTNPIEVVIKKPDISKFGYNSTNRPLIPIGIGKAKNSISKEEKSTGKGAGRRKRAPEGPTSYNYLIRHHPAPPPLSDYYYPSSKEIPQVKSEELSLLMRGVDELDFEDMDSFDDDFDDITKPMTKSLFKEKHKHKIVPVSFMDSFFSNEYFPSQSGQDFDSDSQSKEKTPGHSDDKDAYDIHGYRDPTEDERSVKTKPPAYNLAVSKGHDYRPVRVMSGKPVMLKQPEKVKTVEAFKTKQIHQYPGYALPGASTEASVEQQEKEEEKVEEEEEEEKEDEEESDEEEHHHHHFYDQLKHVHHNPPKGFDPDAFRLTIPSILQQSPHNMNNKKHKHFHHIEDAPVIVKYSKKKKEKKEKKQKKPKKKPMTESEEEANYDEEGELSEKEIENAYKNYDDSQINKDVIHDYEVDESAEETKLMEVKQLKEPKKPQPPTGIDLVNIDRVSNMVTNSTKSKPKIKIPKSFKNFWKLEYKLK